MANRQIIIRRARPKETRIQNAIIWDKNMSPFARFVLIAMLSLPENWDYSVRGMAAMLDVSKDTMSKYLKELEQAGYLLRKQNHADTGQFSGTQYILTDSPGDFGQDRDDDGVLDPPCPNFPAPVLSAPTNSPQKIRTKEKIRTEEKNPPKAPQGGGRARKRKEPRAAPDWKPERFAGFWNFYPKQGRKNKQGAMNAWDNLHPNDDLINRIAEALVKLKATETWKRGIGIPYASTFLNGARWTDADELDDSGSGSSSVWADDEEVL